MKIGVFSKLGASGGSEHRCAEIVNSIQRFSSHDSYLLCEKDLNNKIEHKIDKEVKIIKNLFKGHGILNYNILYDMDIVIVINTDSYSFAKSDYWEGKLAEHHDIFINLSKIPKMVFLFNFVITPSKNLYTISEKCKDVRVLAANQKFLDEISTKENKFGKIWHLPRMMMESPIDPKTISSQKHNSGKIRIGKHSKAHGYKFNDEHVELIRRINSRYGDIIEWDFLGVPNDKAALLKEFNNIVVRPEYSVDVGDYLKGIDIFLFFISWGRNEPWSRAVAEGMMSGCPILATNKAGNIDQIIHGNNGYLCDTVDDFEKYLSILIEDDVIRSQMGLNNLIYCQQFTTERLTSKLLDFII
jgi:glycosyltransferase involved in cell wall biosynthesis